MSLSFDSDDGDGNPRLFAGMYRPNYADLLQPNDGSYRVCSCGTILRSMMELQNHWLQGHFDRPLYRVEQ